MANHRSWNATMTFTTLGFAVKGDGADKAAVDLDRLAASAVRAEAGVTQLASATAKTHAATSQMSLNSANLAAQLQDVVVSAQMGMSPLQIALQQGTQISAVLGPMGATGAVKGLAAAFASVVSPVSLITIGLVSLGAVALQALGNIQIGSEKATDAIARHTDAIADVIKGYEEAEGVVKEYANVASQLPLAAVEIKLGKGLEDANRELDRFRERAGTIGILIANSFNPIEAELGQVLVAFSKGQVGANDLLVETTKIANMDLGPLAFQLSGIARDFAEGAQSAVALQNSLVEITHALAAASSATKGAPAAQLGLESYVEGKRSAEMHQIELDALKAKTPAQERDIAMRRERLKLADDEITEVLREQKVREAGEVAFARASARGGKTASQDADQWEGATRNFQKRTDQVRTEIDLFGKGTYEIERQKAAINLLDKAKDAGILVTAAVTEEIARMSEEYSRASAMLEGLQLAADNRTPFEALGEEIDRLNGMLDLGAISWDTYTRAMGGATASAVATTLGALANLSQGLSNAFEENKALSIATAVLKGAEAIASAYASGNSIGGPVVGAAFAGIAAITAAANVAAVANTDKNSKSISSAGGSGSSAAAPAAAPQSRTASVNLVGDYFSRDAVSSLFERLNQELGVDGLQIVTTHKQA